MLPQNVSSHAVEPTRPRRALTRFSRPGGGGAAGAPRGRGRGFAVLLGLLAAATTTAQRPSPGVLRFEEDWGVLRDPSLRTSPLDSLRYVPLGEGGDYLSLGADARFLYERLENPRGPVNDYWLTRLHLHADVHVGDGWRLYVEPASALEWGDEPARGIDLDALYLLNAFAEAPLWRSADGASSLRARLGRFEMHFGDGRLITYRNPTNVRHYFEGANVMYRSPQWSVDAFAVGFGQPRDGVFDNRVLDDPEWTWGAYARRALGDGPDDGPYGGTANDLAFFYLGHRDPEADFFTASGTEVRHTLGAHLDRQREAWDYQVTLAGQVGRVGALDALAFGASASGGYTWSWEGGSLRAAGLADYWSGDRDSTDARYGGFNPLYPRNSYYRGIAAPWSSNFYDVRPMLSLTLGPLNVTTTSTWYWRASVEDGFYLGWGGTPTLAPVPPAERYLGRQTEGSVRYGLPGNAYVLLVYSNFSPGTFVRENPTPGEIEHFVDVFVGWSF